MNLNLETLKIQLRQIGKFHYLVFIIIIIGGVGFTVYKINTILNTEVDPSFRADKEKILLNNNFDQTTIDKLKQLNYSSNPQKVSLPAGRTNPFSP